MLRDVFLDLSFPSGIAQVTQPFEADFGVRDTLLKQVVKRSGKTAENRILSLIAGSPVRNWLEVILF